MKNKINLLEYSSTFFMLIISPFLGMGLYNLLNKSNIDSTISVIFGYFFSIILLSIFFIINNYNINQNLKEKIKVLFNNKIAIFLIVTLCISLFIMSLCLSYNINSFVISQFLSETPIIYVQIIMGLLIIYINNKGLEVILRVSNLLFYISIILILVAFLGHYNRIELINLLPVLKNEWKVPVMGGINIVLFQSVYIFLLLIIPKKRIINNNKINKIIIIINSIVFFIFLLIIIYTIGSFGIDLTLKYHYPAYIVMKEMTIFGFIDKIENFIIIHWIFEVYITLSLIIYFINKMTNIKPYTIVILNILISIFFFKNSTFYNYFTSKYLPLFSFIIIIIMLIICIKILSKKISHQ